MHDRIAYVTKKRVRSKVQGGGANRKQEEETVLIVTPTTRAKRGYPEGEDGEPPHTTATTGPRPERVEMR